MPLPEIISNNPPEGPHVGKVVIDGQPYTLKEAGDIQTKLSDAINTAEMYVTEADDILDATLQEDVFSHSLAGIVVMNLSPGQWEGTFTAVVATMLNDLAADDKPLEVRLYFSQERGIGMRKMTGWLTGYDSTTATYTFVDGNTFQSADLTGIIIPA
jgi:hypothetical protein